MPRKPRVDVPGAVYHITARGNHQQRIFYTAEDYHVYLRLLQEATRRFGLRVLAYALLPNHVHLLCRRGPVGLAKVMHYVQRRFALHHNRRLGLRGHVFQDRYHAKTCEEEGYLWAVVRYIHNNPVQAGLCDHPGDYPWTSYHAYAAGRWELVDREEAAKLFGPAAAVVDLPARQKAYKPAGEGSRAQRVAHAGEAAARRRQLRGAPREPDGPSGRALQSGERLRERSPRPPP